MRVWLCQCAAFAAALLCVPVSAPAAGQATFARAGAQAASTLLRAFYTGGRWRLCNGRRCGEASSDWGADSLTYALWMAWKGSRAHADATALAAIGVAMPRYSGACGNACPTWSDAPAWDAVALARIYEATGENAFRTRAIAALRDAGDVRFVGGACAAIAYQRARPSPSDLKTLETGANATKAALLLYRATNDRRFLDEAIATYAADRALFLDPSVPLYTVHAIDDGARCTQVAHRFFASVNGDMIWNGIALWQATGRRAFYDEAVETGEAVDTYLSDDDGVFSDVQGENDVEEPLVEAMAALAAQTNERFAREWILRNAAAALSSRASDGVFSRFFDGPPQAVASAWETNGGIALEIAAAAIDGAAAARSQPWDGDVVERVTSLPARITFTGMGVALVGTIGERCVERHIRVEVDGVATFDRTGLWQNPHMPGGAHVLFAWRWQTPGTHTIELEPAAPGESGTGALKVAGVVSSRS